MSASKAFCPLLGIKCTEDRCAWWFIDEGCAIPMLASAVFDLNQIAQDVEHISLNGVGPDSHPELEEDN
jgi:hypothetical protein